MLEGDVRALSGPPLCYAARPVHWSRKHSGEFQIALTEGSGPKVGNVEPEHITNS
jgi:hypothetical protein